VSQILFVWKRRSNCPVLLSTGKLFSYLFGFSLILYTVSLLSVKPFIRANEKSWSMYPRCTQGCFLPSMFSWFLWCAFLIWFWWQHLAADRSLKFASCRGGRAECSCPKERHGDSLSCPGSNTQLLSWEANTLSPSYRHPMLCFVTNFCLIFKLLPLLLHFDL